MTISMFANDTALLATGNEADNEKWRQNQFTFILQIVKDPPLLKINEAAVSYWNNAEFLDRNLDTKLRWIAEKGV